MSKEFANLNLLKYIINIRSKNLRDPSKVAVISVQHLLETTGSLFESLVDLGISPLNILLMGKLYSNNIKVTKKITKLGIEVVNNSDSSEPGVYGEIFKQDCLHLWDRMSEKISEKNIETIIVLDDGGVLISTVPFSIIKKFCVIAVEQTTSGIELNKNSPISIISVAGSAVKKHIEPAFISQAIIQKAKRYLLMYAPKNIGIFGLGNIGRALVKDLSDHYHLSVFDHNEDITNALIKIDSDANSLYLNADFIIGATGNDVSNLNWVKKAGKDKILMSVSSGDKEFKGLLNISKKYIQEPVSSLLDNVVINTEDGYRLKILRGGTPINFDNNIHSVLPEYIQLTRALLLIGVIQAIENSYQLCESSQIVKLDPIWQRKILEYWYQTVDTSKFEFSTPVMTILKDHDFIERESFGI